MDKMIGLGTRMQKAIASGDYDNIYDATGAERAPTAARTAAPAPSAPPAGDGMLHGPGGSLPAFAGTTAAAAPVAQNLNTVLQMHLNRKPVNS